jgi:hypothetical protein
MSGIHTTGSWTLNRLIRTALVPKKTLESRRRQFRVAHRMLN